jgi:CRISP-associated protein Cas1
VKDLRQLPKLRDSLSYLYVEHCRVDKEQQAIAIHDQEGRVPVPCASLALLLLGPGTTITHAAVTALADNNCLTAWCGEEGVRLYAFGLGGSRSAAPLLHQARLVSDADSRLAVAKRMYRMRFQEEPDPNLNLEQLRGWEGRRVRDAYAHASRETGVPWHGRNYDRSEWSISDPVNRALSAANSCLYGVCHAAILSLGFSPALGFIHTGKTLSFVYDIADLYKTAITIPAAFRCAAEGVTQLERRTRLACRDLFRELRLLSRLADEIPRALGLKDAEIDAFFAADEDMALPGSLWDPERGEGVQGGENYGDPDPGARAAGPAGGAEPLDD